MPLCNYWNSRRLQWRKPRIVFIEWLFMRVTFAIMILGVLLMSALGALFFMLYLLGFIG